MNKQIPLLKVFMPSSVGPSVIRTLNSGQITEGPKVAEFEKHFGEFIGNNGVVATNSCSGALLMALQMAGVDSDSEVITTALTCQSTNQPILQLGGKIVWADVQRNTGNIDPQDVEKKITAKTKAIIAMHWAGQPCDIKELNHIAKKHKIKLIEDAASAFGAIYKNEMVANHSDFVCFSFQAVKHMTTGDGGALIVQEEEYKERAMLLRNNGNNKYAKRSATNWFFDIGEAGWKFHMNDIAATIGIEQLKFQKELIEKRQFNGKYFNTTLSNIKGLELLEQKNDRLSAYWIYTVLVEDREAFVKHLKNHGIQFQVLNLQYQ